MAYEIPPRYAATRPGGGPPSIYVENHFDHFPGSGGYHPRATMLSPSTASNPMSIRDARHDIEDNVAPPPLPPPRYLPYLERPTKDLSESTRNHNRGQSGDSWHSSSSIGSPGHSLDERPEYGRRRSDRTIKPEQRDEGYHSLTSNLSASQDPFPKKLFMSHDQFQLNRPSGNDYDSSVLKRLDARRTLENRSPPRRSGFGSSADVVPRFGSSENRMPSLLTPLSLPIRNNSSYHDSLSPGGHFTETPSAVSPRSTPFNGVGSNEYRSPSDLTDPDRSPRMRSRRNNSGSIPDDATVSTQGSHEHADETDFPMEETSGIRRLHIDDPLGRLDHPTIGQKRRASSPPGDEISLQGLPSSGELLKRREGASRASPTPRLTVVPQGSMSSASSGGRSGSYSSLTATTATSMSSFGRRSPSGLSSAGLSPIDGACHSPFSTSISMVRSPRGSISRAPHQRNISDSRPLASPRKLNELPKANISRIQGFFMCDCCPKKPKKFETVEELNAHEAEKQYECAFCGNRFKNKNEAERHQNSLHVRRHSWSCSALHHAGYDKAFHDSSNRPEEFDACGYCGEEFVRSGGAGRTRLPTQQDWDERLRHLQEVHKFRECNSSKKFYRADHFRQHLKHSHAGTSGKWTNMLETACMIEEEPPQPR